MSVLQVENISVSYGTTRVLFDVSMDIEEHESIAVIGPNGAGKSTLLYAIIGIMIPDEGRVIYRGDDITGIESNELVGRGMALCPQGARVFSNLTVKENLLMGGVTQSNVISKENLETLYDMFPILEERRAQKAGSLSGGEQQMLAIGRALMSDPDLLLFDEPSAGLAPKMVERVEETLQTINQERDLTMIIIEQNVDLAINSTDRTYLLESGELVMSDSSAALADSDVIMDSFFGI